MMEEILRELNDAELQIVAGSCGLNALLEPLKNNAKKYQKYMKLLGGRAEKKNPMLPVFLPKVAVKIYRSGDDTYEDLFLHAAEAMKEELMSNMSEELGYTPDGAQLEGMTAEELAHVLDTYQKKDPENYVDLDFLWLQYKLNGLDYPEEKREKVEELLVADSEEEADDHAVPVLDAGTTLGTDAGTDSGTDSGIDSDAASTLDSDAGADTEPGTDSDADSEPTPSKQKKETDKERKERLKQTRKQQEKERKEKEKQERELQRQEQERLQKEEQEREKKRRLEKEQQAREEQEVLEAKTMYESRSRTYIGKINIINTHYNFTPLYEKDSSGTMAPLHEYELDRLFDNAVYKNIEFAFSVYNEEDKEFMESRFTDNQLIVFEFSKDELEPNLDNYGSRKNTAYMVRAHEMYKKGKIRFLSDERYYKIRSGSEVLDELGSKKVLRVAYENMVEGEEILIDAGDGFLAGPYKVKNSPSSIGFYVSTDIPDNNYIISGYRESDCRRMKFRDSSYSWSTNDVWEYYFVEPSCERRIKDTISPKALLKFFNASRENYKLTEFDDAGEDVDSIVDTVLAGESIPESIRHSRAEKLKEMLASMQEEGGWNEDALDIVYKLIINNPDSMQSEEIVDAIIDRHPELLDNVTGIKRIEDRIERGQATLKGIEDEINRGKQKQKEVDNEISKNLAQKQKHLDTVLEQLKLANDIESIRAGFRQAEKTSKTYEDRINWLRSDSSKLEDRFSEMIDSYSEKIADIAFDGFVSGKMLQASAEWSNIKKKEEFDSIAQSVNSIKSEFTSSEDVVEYLVNTIQIARPQYDRNFIINILTCICQGFLTVFSGNPGCGKTSICNIIARSMGLTRLNEMLREPCETCDINRYVPVSVERGWTSKRDFIGYYNPLTRTFEENNKSVLNGLRILDYEARNGIAEYPYWILLDEANLSPMEYYWADFMNACDDSEIVHGINLGNDNIYKLPETLHFLATINNDNTTEELSPRLIDRAWTITLPKSITKYGDTIPDKDIRLVPWHLLREAFYGDPIAPPPMDPEISGIYAAIRKHMRIQDYEISARTDFAIKRYCNSAAAFMEDEEFSSINAVALDYAVSQKLLPKIEGSGDDFKSWLKGLYDICYNNNLYQSGRIIEGIINNGDRKNMGYYRFF